jgi:hypothetical protein
MDRHEAVLLFNALAGAQAIRSFEKSSNFSRILHLQRFTSSGRRVGRLSFRSRDFAHGCWCANAGEEGERVAALPMSWRMMRSRP